MSNFLNVRTVNSLDCQRLKSVVESVIAAKTLKPRQLQLNPHPLFNVEMELLGFHVYVDMLGTPTLKRGGAGPVAALRFQFLSTIEHKQFWRFLALLQSTYGAARWSNTTKMKFLAP